MRSFFTTLSFALAALLLLVGHVSARDLSNSTHFVDPTTNFTIQHFDCDVNRGQASEHFNKTVAFLHRNTRRPGQVGSRSAALVKKQTVSPAITVPVYIHLITTTAKQGTLTQTAATAQVAALNTVYNKYGITFNLQNVTTDANDAWAVAEGSDMDALKAARRYGSYSALNLYFHTDLSGGVLGTCTLPSQVTDPKDPSQYVSDGCNVNAATMPGGSMTGYNQGMTAVHETGHWLGLLHTFEGYSCTGDGDSIADTPQQSTSTDGCPTSPVKDSCPAVAGVDLIHNYMDYSSDACYESFTPNQVTRIQSMWQEYRQGM
ncbi:Extracellular metalloprotease [Lecanosticta acicola]|uniref:Extracellular metalloprotease n=1 Tax=Lecanosticta acicola TaxID=111012 RepID=A0AAI9EBH4_9PEZI|nr:Extracellular metalloprotease [Lecanosticta acicola]